MVVSIGFAKKELMKNKSILFCSLFLTACASKTPVVQPDPIKTESVKYPMYAQHNRLSAPFISDNKWRILNGELVCIPPQFQRINLNTIQWCFIESNNPFDLTWDQFREKNKRHVSPSPKSRSASWIIDENFLY